MNIEEGEFDNQGNKNWGKNKKLSVDLNRSFRVAAQFLMIIPKMVAPYVIYLSFASFLISSRDLTQVTEICDCIVLLEKGKIINVW